MSQLSGIKDVDREILGKLDDRNLLNACLIDKYTWNTVCDDLFFKRRLLARYLEIEKHKFERETWKQFFLRAIRCISKMKEKYSYSYSFGDFDLQYNLLGYNRIDMFYLAAGSGELALIIKCLKEGVDIHYLDDYALRRASQHGHLEVVKYLVEQGADIHAENDYALTLASCNGHLDVVKYLKSK